MNVLLVLAGLALLAVSVLSALDCKFLLTKRYWKAPFRKEMQHAAALPYAIMGLALLVAGLVGSSGTSLTFWGIVVLVFLAGLLLLRRIWRKYLH